MYKLFNVTSRRSVKSTKTNKVQKFKNVQQAERVKKTFSPSTRKNLQVKKVSSNSIKRKRTNPFGFW